MELHLLIVGGPDKGRTFPLPAAGSLIVGRSQATDTSLNDPQVSRRHFMVEVDAQGVTVRDLDSSSGTFVNRQRVGQQRLRPGDTIHVGSTELCLLALDAGERNAVRPRQAAHALTADSADSAVEASTPLEPAARVDPGAATVRTSKSHAPKGTLSGKPAPADPAQLVGMTINRFRLHSLIARGANGVVFKAHDPKRERTVAVKVFRPETATDQEQRERFLRTLRAVMPLRHPNLVTVYNAGKSGPFLWLAMEFVEGEDLTQMVKRVGVVGRLGWRQAFQIAGQVARALELAHRHKIVHRDIKPSNVLVRRKDGVVKLGDLALAQGLDGGLTLRLPRPNMPPGELAYLAPEQTRGESLDGRADFYSLGAVVYALLTGRPPFEADTADKLLSRIHGEAPVPPRKYQLTLPALVEAVVLKMMEKRPEDRYQTAAELLAELDRVTALLEV